MTSVRDRVRFFFYAKKNGPKTCPVLYFVRYKEMAEGRMRDGYSTERERERERRGGRVVYKKRETKRTDPEAEAVRTGKGKGKGWLKGF